MSSDPVHDEKVPQWMTLTCEDACTQGQVETVVEGSIPTWLRGTLYRNGAGVYDVKDTHIRHFFDGFSVLHKFCLRDGRVTFTSSLLDSSSLQEAMGSPTRLVPTPSGVTPVTDPCKSIFKGAQSSYFAQMPAEKTDNTSVHVVEFGDALYAMTETATINRIDRNSLKRLQCIDMTKMVAVHTGSAHPHFSPDGQTMYSYGTNFNHTKAYNIISIPCTKEGEGQMPLSQAKVIASVPSRWPNYIAYNHSFGMSDRYFVVLDQPVAFNTKKFQISHVDMQGVIDTLVIRKREPLQLRLIDRKTSRLLPFIYETQSAFVFHFINCYEEEDYLIVDVVIYHRIQAIQDLYLASLKKTEYRIPDAGSFARFVLPLNLQNVVYDFNLVNLPGSKATAVLESDGGNTISIAPDYLSNEKIVMELPRINYQKFAGKKYPYVYGNSIFSDYNRLVKVDTQSGTVKEWTGGRDYYPGEPIFVSSPEGMEEDDGVLLSPVLSQAEGKSSFLLVLDASSFTELARAYVPGDQKMCMTFHGSYSQRLAASDDSDALGETQKQV